MFSIVIHFKMLFIAVIKAEFSASLLQSSVSHDPSQIFLIWWFDFQKTFLKQLCCLIFLWKLWLYIFWTYYGDAFVHIITLVVIPSSSCSPTEPSCACPAPSARDCHEQTATLLSHSLRPTRRPLQRPSEQERMVVRTLWWALDCQTDGAAPG